MWTATVRMRGTDEATAVAIVLVVVGVLLSGQPTLLGFLLIPVLLIVLGRWRVTVDRRVCGRAAGSVRLAPESRSTR